MPTDGCPLPNLDALAARLAEGPAKELVESLTDVGSQGAVTEQLTEQLAARVVVIEQETQDALPEVA